MIQRSKSVRNLGFYLDEFLDMQSHISKLCQLIHYSLRNIGHVRNLIDDETCKMLVHSLITSRMDYCNSLLYGLPKNSIARLQLLQNATARIGTKSKKSNHITPVLQSLHWLPVEKRIAFKIDCHCFKRIHGSAPDYLTSLVSIYNPNRTLHSSSAVSLDQSIPKSNFSRHAFSFSAPSVWNALSADTRRSNTLSTFKSSLKTAFFRLAYL